MLNEDYCVFRERLMVLAEFLEELPAAQWNYTIYVGENWDGNENLEGTTACGITWAVVLFGQETSVRLKKTVNGVAGPIEFTVEGEPTPSYKVGARLFGLQIADFDYLFMPAPCPFVEPIDPRARSVRGKLYYKAPAEEVAQLIRFLASVRWP